MIVDNNDEDSEVLDTCVSNSLLSWLLCSGDGDVCRCYRISDYTSQTTRWPADSAVASTCEYSSPSFSPHRRWLSSVLDRVIATVVARFVVRVSAGHTAKSCENGWTDRDSSVPMKPCIRWGVYIGARAYTKLPELTRNPLFSKVVRRAVGSKNIHQRQLYPSTLDNCYWQNLIITDFSNFCALYNNKQGNCRYQTPSRSGAGLTIHRSFKSVLPLSSHFEYTCFLLCLFLICHLFPVASSVF